MEGAVGETKSRSDSQRTSVLIRTTFGKALTIWGTRIAPALVAPLGILLVIPILVGGVGLAIWWQGRVAVKKSVDTMAFSQFSDRAKQGARHARELLVQAYPLTDNMVSYVRRVGIDPPLEEFALRFRDMLRACPGVAYISFGTHEGHYFGVYLDAGRRYRLTHRIYTGPGKTHTRDYDIAADGTLTLVGDNPGHGFDPRQRPWWKATVKNGRRTWSEPYVWFDIGVVGITCSEPIRDDEDKLLAVTTVDFHLNGLSEFVESLGTDEGGRTFVFADSRDVIAFPGQRQRFGQGEAKGKKLKVEELGDTVAALFAAMPALGEEALRFPFEADGSPYLAALEPISLGDDVSWYVATYGPTDPLTAPAAAHQRNALIVSAVALLVAILVAVFFARFIVRTHLLVERAEHRAREADARARKLGSYRMTRKLDEGGMGEVWIAEHAMLARPAAIKLIRPKFLQDRSAADRQAAVERFRREARTIAGLRSRHTIGIYDFGVADDGALFYVMELLDGIDLYGLVKEHGPVPPSRVVDILLQAASSLHEAHERGVIHRDIKPPNIFLCREADEVDIVKVLDFGMARDTAGGDASMTTADAITGTPAFMPPEQARNAHQLDGRADIYALGCVAYWLLAGRHVFERDTVMAVLVAHTSAKPEPFATAVKNPVPEALEAVVMRCLAKDPGDRPADMAALARELEEVRAGLPDDGWNAEARRAFWDAIPSHFEKAVGEPAESIRLSPDR
jgi:tRNA A-37 threonylcarbamoyl transferase component Bud32